ncbi:MAG TPA: ABC transporter permease [Steroidobacteraceae bacterium]
MANDLRFALRMVLTHRWFSAAVVVTLALGIGANTMVFTLVNAVLLRPPAVPGGERLVAITYSNLSHGDRGIRLSWPDFRAYRDGASSLESIQTGSSDDGVLSDRGHSLQTYNLEVATPGIFAMLHIRPVLGRGFVASDGDAGAAPVVVLGYGVWKQRYNSSAGVIGQTVRVNGKPATIIGVMPAGFKFPVHTDLWMPIAPSADLENRDHHGYETWAMLKPGVRIAQAASELNGIAGRLATQYPHTNKDLTLNVETFNQRYNGGPVRVLFLLMLASVGFVLLIACADVANMMLSRGLVRQREMSIRAALGASRWRVIRQLLMESVLLSIFGGILGLGLAALGVHGFDLGTQDVGKPYWIDFRMDYSVFGYFAILCIASGVLFGIVPALRSSKFDLNEVLKDGARSVGRHRGGRLSAVLIVLQFALTLVLLTGAGVFVHQLLQALTANRFVPGDKLLSARVELPDDRYKDIAARQRFYDQLLPRLQAIPGVSNAAIVSNLPGLGAAHRDIEIEHAFISPGSARPQASLIVESPGYLDTIDLPLLLGRDFNASDGTAGHKAAIVTLQCARHFWPGQTAIGKRFRFYDDKNIPGDWITVVGVAGDMTQELNEKKPNPLLFVPFQQEGWDGMELLVESNINVNAALRPTVASLDPDLPLRDVSNLSDEIAHQEWFIQLLTIVFLSFAFIALIMASVGLYAVIAHATASRTQEIGVRMALGASARNILLLVMRRGLWQIAAGLGVGLAAAFPVTRIMSSLPIGVSPSNPDVFLVVAALLASVGLFACWLPARRAAALDPVKAIRYE